MSHRLHKDEKVRHLILELVPMLAAFNIGWFGKSRFGPAALSPQDRGMAFQDVCISHILQRIGTGVGSGGSGSGSSSSSGGGGGSSSGSGGGHNDVGSDLQGSSSDRPPAYRALGELAVATGSRILNNTAVLDATLDAIQSGFRSVVFCTEAVACLRLVVSATVKTNQHTPRQIERAFTKSGRMVRDIFRGGVNQDLVR